MRDCVFGLLGEFDSPEALLAAARKARKAGYSKLDAFTPFPVEGLAKVLRLPRPRISVVGLLGGFAGGGFALLMQLYVNYDYPLDVGGRPLYALSAFAVVVFELTILVSALSMIAAMLWQNGLPRLNHPIFGADQIARATKDRFFLCVLAEDAAFDAGKTADFLQGTGALSVQRVPS